MQFRQLRTPSAELRKMGGSLVDRRKWQDTDLRRCLQVCRHADSAIRSRLTRMYGPTVRCKRFVDLVVSGLASMYPVSS